ncbi:GNAT family N-acetyltransferase [Labilibaculum euxinus]
MKFEFISNKSIFLDEVIKLGTKNSKTLGFMPEGGFREHAKKGWIIIAHKKNELLGYLLFRAAKKNDNISITHLCVKDCYRGEKISIKLIDFLKNKFEYTHSGIVLNCREDYNSATKLWETYGFISRGRKRSRSIEENHLIIWHYELNKSDLFSTPIESNRIKVILDANILIKLRDPHLAEYSDVKALLADWLIDDVEYYFTQEMYNEIRRDKDKSRAKSTSIFLQNFIELKGCRNKSLKIEKELRELLNGTRINDLSDRRQLAEFIVSDIKYFITFDKEILAEREDIENKYNVKIMEPIELIMEIDQLIHSNEYCPERLADAHHETKRVTSGQLNDLTDKFLHKDLQEKRYDLKNSIRELIQTDKEPEMKTIVSLENEDLALWGYTKSENKISVPVIRTIKGKLSFTLFCQIIQGVIEISIENKIQIIEITDKYTSKELLLVLEDFGFILHDDKWVKITLTGIIKSDELFINFPILAQYFDTAQYRQNFDDHSIKTNIFYDLERKLFPLKFKDIDIPCYIIPIKPYWASQLFDKYASSQTLFGADPHKIWNRENIYFRNIKPISEKYPARILWYASTGKESVRQNAIVATSYLDEVTIDSVKIQFRTFKRFGIYSWDNVYKLANNKTENEIKALKFSETEVFKNIIVFQNIVRIFLTNGRKKNTFASPVEISKEIYFQLYKLK